MCIRDSLYPFRETIAKPDVTRAEAIENIDIGGPSMVRAADVYKRQFIRGLRLFTNTFCPPFKNY